MEHRNLRFHVDASSRSLQGLTTLSQLVTPVLLHSPGTGKISCRLATPKFEIYSQLGLDWKEKLFLRIIRLKGCLPLLGTRFDDAERKLVKTETVSLGKVKSRRPHSESENALLALHLPGSAMWLRGSQVRGLVLPAQKATAAVPSLG